MHNRFGLTLACFFLGLFGTHRFFVGHYLIACMLAFSSSFVSISLAKSTWFVQPSTLTLVLFIFSATIYCLDLSTIIFYGKFWYPFAKRRQQPVPHKVDYKLNPKFQGSSQNTERETIEKNKPIKLPNLSNLISISINRIQWSKNEYEYTFASVISVNEKIFDKNPLLLMKGEAIIKSDGITKKIIIQETLKKSVTEILLKFQIPEKYLEKQNFVLNVYVKFIKSSDIFSHQFYSTKGQYSVKINDHNFKVKSLNVRDIDGVLEATTALESNSGKLNYIFNIQDDPPISLDEIHSNFISSDFDSEILTRNISGFLNNKIYAVYLYAQEEVGIAMASATFELPDEIDFYQSKDDEKITKENKEIFWESEPSGLIGVGTLSQSAVKRFQRLYKTESMKDSEFIKYPDKFVTHLVEGISLNKKHKIDNHHPATTCKKTITLCENKNVIQDGLYFIQTKLSKCSRRFKILANENFDPNKLVIEYYKINMPEIVDEQFGPLNFELISALSYDGSEIEEYNKAEIIKQSHDQEIHVVQVKKGKLTPLYKNRNYNQETWSNKIPSDVFDQETELIDDFLVAIICVDDKTYKYLVKNCKKVSAISIAIERHLNKNNPQAKQGENGNLAISLGNPDSANDLDGAEIISLLKAVPTPQKTQKYLILTSSIIQEYADNLIFQISDLKKKDRKIIENAIIDTISELIYSSSLYATRGLFFLIYENEMIDLGHFPSVNAQSKSDSYRINKASLLKVLKPEIIDNIIEKTEIALLVETKLQDNWNHKFLKVSQRFGKIINVIGPLSNSEEFILQKYANGHTDSGYFPNNDGDFILNESSLYFPFITFLKGNNNPDIKPTA